jgi:hypothetical protein
MLRLYCYCLGRLRPEMFPGIGVLPGPDTESHVVNRGTPAAPLDNRSRMSQRGRVCVFGKSHQRLKPLLVMRSPCCGSSPRPHPRYGLWFRVLIKLSLSQPELSPSLQPRLGFPSPKYHDSESELSLFDSSYYSEELCTLYFVDLTSW